MQKSSSVSCRPYHVENVTKTDEARVQLFNKCKALDALPPTTEALHGHIERAHYQTLIWRQSDKAKPEIPPSTDFGWKVESGYLVAKLSTLPPVSKACKAANRDRKGATTGDVVCRWSFVNIVEQKLSCS